MVTMSATKVLSSAKRKKTKPHKLGEKKRLYLSNDDDVVPRPQEASRESSEERQERWTNSPPAHTAEGLSQECQEGTPRRRGRPKGSGGKSKTLCRTLPMSYKARNGQDLRTIHHTTPSPKKEHPRLSDVPYRGRGRPKGSTKKVRSDSEQASPQVTKQPAGENTPKRARGRPKGSPNKKPSKAAMMLKYGIPKLGRGRPKKLVATNGAVPKRGRGRPKGSANKMPMPGKEGGSPGGAGLKKRGRPRKKVSRVVPTPPPPSGIKRPRGRPKLSVPEVVEFVENVEYEDSVSE